MLSSRTAGPLRLGVALLIIFSMASTALGGALRVSAQDDALPGFAPLPAEAELLGGASGIIEAEGIGTLLVERLLIAPGSGLDPVAGPFVLMVERGSLIYEDDLGLEANVVAGVSQFFTPGEGDSLTNPGDEPAVVIRAALIVDTPINGNPRPEDGGDDQDDEGVDETGDESGDGPGEDTPVRPRDGFLAPAPVFQHLGGIAALIQDPATTPDEVVISLTDAGFNPDTVSIIRGGVLVIENAGDTACTFTIADLEVAIELAEGDIEQVTIDGPAGEYSWECRDADDDSIGDGILTIVDGSSGSETADDAAGEDAATTTPEPVADAADADGPIGQLLQSQLALDNARELYAATVVLHPGAVISLTDANGAVGLIVFGGDLGVVRAGRAPATLRNGRAVTLPPGTSADLMNDGESPITIIVAGVTGSSIDQSSPVTPAPTNDDGDPDDEATSENAGTNTLYELFPTDDALAALGLYPTWAAFTEIDDPASNTFWFPSPSAASSLLGDANWIQSAEIRYSSNGKETNFGTVNILGILIDRFEDEDGAANLFTYIQSDPSGNGSDVLAGVREVDGVIEFDLSGSGVDVMIVAIHTGSYVISIFASGENLDAQALIYEVAGLIFGAVG